LANRTSRYAELLRADQDNHSLLWSGGNWRNWWLADGKLVEKPVMKPVDEAVDTLVEKRVS
jgi:hypothetical protein